MFSPFRSFVFVGRILLNFVEMRLFLIFCVIHCLTSVMGEYFKSVFNCKLFFLKVLKKF